MLEDKVQEEINENSRLRVKQTEDEKNWKGIDSKISSTNALCDQLTETLEQLTDQTRTGMGQLFPLCESFRFCMGSNFSMIYAK